MRDSTELDLASLLQQEREAIITADFAAIEALSARKQSLLIEIEGNRGSPNANTKNRDALIRNQKLLQASIDGVISARARIKDLLEVRDGLRVYDNKGQLSSVPNISPDLTKRT